MTEVSFSSAARTADEMKLRAVLVKILLGGRSLSNFLRLRKLFLNLEREKEGEGERSFFSYFLPKLFIYFTTFLAIYFLLQL